MSPNASVMASSKDLGRLGLLPLEVRQQIWNCLIDDRYCGKYSWFHNPHRFPPVPCPIQLWSDPNENLLEPEFDWFCKDRAWYLTLEPVKRKKRMPCFTSSLHNVRNCSEALEHEIDDYILSTQTFSFTQVSLLIECFLENLSA